MRGLKLLSRLRSRLKRRSAPPLDASEAEWGFGIDTLRKLVLSYQDGGAPALWFPEDANLAAELGHLELMKASKGTFRYSADGMDRAAKGGFVSVLKFLWQQGYDCTAEAMDGAAKRGHLDAIIWLHENTHAGATKAAMDSAAAGGHLSVVHWLHLNRREGCTVSAMNWAAGGGHLDVVKWLHYNRKEGCTTAAFDRAAMNNHAHVIMWLVANRGEGGTEKALQWAASRGHMQIVELLSLPKQDKARALTSTHSSNTRGKRSFSLADVGHGLNIPSFVKREYDENKGLGGRQLSFSCSKFAMDKAAQGGHVDVLQLLHEQGNSCSTSAMDWAAAFGQTEAVRWLSENRTEGCTKDAMDHAAANGHLETVKWLHNNRNEGCTRYALTDAAGNGHVTTVEWLHRHRHEGCGRRAMDDAAANGHLEMVRWLHRNRNEGCSDEAMERSARNGHLEMVKLLHQTGASCTCAAIRLAKVHGHQDIYNFLNAKYPGKTASLDFYTDAIVLAEKDMVDDDRRRQLEVQKETLRRRHSVMADNSRARTGRQAPRPIIFGQDGKPSLSRINTFCV